MSNTKVPGEVTGWGDRIRLAREGVEISQADLATNLEVGPSTVYRYETEKTAPDLVTLVKIAGLTKRSVQWIATGQDVQVVVREVERKSPASPIGVPGHLTDTGKTLEERVASIEQRNVPEPPGAVLPGVTIRVAGQPSVFMDWRVSGRDDRIEIDVPVEAVAGRDNAK